MRRGIQGALARPFVIGAVIVLAVGCVNLGEGPAFTPTGTPTGRPPASAGTSPAPSSTKVGPTQPPQPTQTSTGTPHDGETPGPTQPPGSSGPQATIDPELARQIDEVISQVPAVRELTADAAVPYEFITREQFREDLIELEFEEIPEATRRAEERLLKRLGLLPADADLDQLLLDLYGGQVAAFYRPDTKRFYIIQRDEPFGPSDKIIVAHEYTHALQDQHFDLEDDRIKDVSEGDAALGQLAAIEGDATLSMQLWAQNNLTPDELLEVLFGSLGGLDDPTLANMPWILRRQLEFPYGEGFSFVQQVHQAGGFEHVNALLQDPPESTEQILHPEKFFADEQPIDETVAISAPAGFETVYEQTMGELLMQVWVAGDETPDVLIPGLPVEWPYAETAAGWGGDRMSMYEHSDGRWAIVWETAWDSATDMQEFAARAGEVLFNVNAFSQAFPGRDQASNEYVIVLAGDQETLSALTAPE